jgi:hypothetical protein
MKKCTSVIWRYCAWSILLDGQTHSAARRTDIHVEDWQVGRWLKIHVEDQFDAWAWACLRSSRHGNTSNFMIIDYLEWVCCCERSSICSRYPLWHDMNEEPKYSHIVPIIPALRPVPDEHLIFLLREKLPPTCSVCCPNIHFLSAVSWNEHRLLFPDDRLHNFSSAHEMVYGE